MRLKNWVLAAAILFQSLAIGAARADDETDIKAIYAKIAEEAQKGETATYEKSCAPDFKYVTLLGKETNKEAWAQELKQTLAHYKAPTAATVVKAFSLKGEEANVTATLRITGEGSWPENRMGNLNVAMTEKTTWAKTGEGWKMKLSKHVMLEAKRDKQTIQFRGTPEAEEMRQGVQDIYNAFSDLYAKQDWAGLSKALPDDYPVTDASGAKITKAELIDRLKSGAKNLANPIVLVNIQKVELADGKLKVVRLGLVIGDVMLPDGKTARLNYLQSTREIWVKKEKNWGSLGSEELYAEATLDGKLIPLALISGK